MKKHFTNLLVVVAAPLFTLTIANAQPSGGSMSMPMKPAAPAAVSMPLTDGEVIRVDKELGEFVLKHGDLPNLGMPAMTMAFSVSDKAVINRFKKGDKVRFNAEIVKGKPTITHIEPAR